MNQLLLLLWLSNSCVLTETYVRGRTHAVMRATPFAPRLATRADPDVQRRPDTVATERPAQRPADRWIAPDKLQHFLLAMAVTSFTFGAADLAGAGDDARMGIAISAGALAAVGKEVADLRSGARVSARDLAWDALGILAAVAILRSAR